ncbi:hypothetical protein JCM10212_005935 [Sporobolomyces blumeae]
MVKDKPRARRQDPRQPTDAPPAASPRSTRKRPREPDATAPSPETTALSPDPGLRQLEEEVDDAAREARQAKKSKGPDASESGDRSRDGDEGNADRPSALSTSSSSSTLQGPSSVDESGAAEALSGIDDASTEVDPRAVEERRKAKGKGKAVERDDDINAEDDDARLRQDLAFKNSLIASQSALLSSLRAAVACSVCLETLDKPYALVCGHVACRKCLLEWFFRPDPSAEEDRGPSSDSSSSSSSSTSSQSSSSSSSSSSSDSSSSSENGSTGSSYVGGSLGGRDFRIRNAGQASFDAIADRLFIEGLGAPRDRIAGPTNGARDAANNRIEGPAEVEDENESDPKEGELDPHALRLARLARFGGGGGASNSDGATSTGRPVDAPQQGQSTATSAASNPASATSQPEPSRSRTPPAPAAGPSPPVAAEMETAKARSKPIAVPKGQHRTKNLVCPHCRTPCSERAPHRIFVLSDLLELVRTAEQAGMMHSNSTPAPVDAARLDADEAHERVDLPGMDETDQSWAGLFPGPGGTESSRDRRSRLAQIVRDDDDGVRRCGECNWEIDERSGLCEGCGRPWDMSDDSDSSSDRGGGLGRVFGSRGRPVRRPLGRVSHNLAFSDRSDDDESISMGEEQDPVDLDDYESDDFLVRTDDDDDEEVVDARPRRRGFAPGFARRRRRDVEVDSDSRSETDSESEASGSDQDNERDRTRKSDKRHGVEADHLSLSPGSGAGSESGGPGSQDGTTDEEEEHERAETRQRRRRRQEGEVIDLDSDTDDDEEQSSTPEDEASSSGDSEEAVSSHAQARTRKKRVIQLDSDSSE